MDKRILELLGSADYVPSNVPELLSQLGLKPNQQQVLQGMLKSLIKQGKILQTKGNRYIIAKEADLIPGVIQITRGGRGFVQPAEPGIGEISIPERNTGTAMHGDRVLVRLDVRPQGFRKPGPEENIGTVVRVLERKRSTFVGTLQRTKQFLHVTPDDPRLPGSVYVTEPRDVGRKPNMGDKVVVEFTQWESRQASPEGEIIEVLGAPDEEGVDMLSVLRHYDLPLSFPKNVLHEANAIAKSRADNQPGAEECAGREDCRGHNVITIDPDDAKDFDDAICLQKHGSNQWRLWVHIADVSHYVQPGGALDVEARKRGNSTYLVDRVIPMLPEALSNELCSLKPNIDRLTKCVEFILSKDGQVVSSKFYPAVIHSKRRYSYQQAYAIIQRGTAEDDIERLLLDAHHLAQKVRHLRFKAGSLDLDFPENKIRLDENGRVLRIERLENDASHQLIEEYMLLANEAVAGRLMALNKPAVYRVHEAPKEKKLNDYRDDVLSHHIQCGNLNYRPEVQKLLARLAQEPIGQALKIGFLRSLMRARYAVEPLGHYGLAKTKYAHFTSPIRRYADLVVHRALFDKKPLSVSDATQVAEHITTTEKNSADAERDSKDVKLYAYLKAQIASKKPHPYPGLITDVRNFGFFVDVPGLGLSGAVPLSAIADDFFVFDPASSQLVGRHTRQVFKLGDNVVVQIYRVDSVKKQVDFQLVQEKGAAARKRPTRGEEPLPRGGARETRRGLPKGTRTKDGPRNPPPPSADKGKNKKAQENQERRRSRRRSRR